MSDPQPTGSPADQPTVSGGRTPTAFADRVDALSLEQALLDFEVANARVLDLTHRLTELNRELVELRSEHERLRIAHNRSLARRAAPRVAVEAGAYQALRVARAVKRRLR
jgi:hypothetical protein